MPNQVYPVLQGDAGFPITPSDTADIKDDAGNKEELSQVVVHNNTSAGGQVRVMPAGQRVPPAVTLTGASGTANISVNGTNYLATFSSNLTTTATNFVNTHQKTLANLGIRLSRNGTELRFFGANPATFSITNATGDLSGTVLTVSPVTIYINAGDYSPFAVSRVYATSPAPPATLVGVYGGQR